MSKNEQQDFEKTPEKTADAPEALNETQDVDEAGEAPSPFEDIPEDKIARAKRTKRILIVAIVLLVLVLLGAGAASVYYYLTYGQSEEHLGQTRVEPQSANGALQDRGTTEAIGMPQLAGLFNKTPEEALGVLGSDYAITKTESASGDGAGQDETSETEGAAQVVTISYVPSEQQEKSVGSTQVQNIYATLNEAGTISEVYFVSSMNLLGYAIVSFSELVATKQAYVDALSTAGVVGAEGIEYTAPTEDEYLEYVDPEASDKKIKKEAATIEGTLASEQAPKNYEVTFAYDYGATGVEVAADRQPTQRMLYIKLS